MLKEQNKAYSVIPTVHNPDEDFFYYVNKEDEDEAFESLGYNQRCNKGHQEDDFRVSKFWGRAVYSEALW